MTLRELGLALRRALAEAGVEASALEARLLLAKAAGMTPEALLASPHCEASPDAAETAEALLRRRLAGEPVAYLLGSADFYGMRFAVTPDVLIPRSDTETLVAAALARTETAAPRVLDLGAGSGCVGCAIAAALPRSRAVLADNSPAALGVAGENVRRLGLAGRVTCVELDMLRPPAPELGSFDLIVSNPPYIRRDEIPALDASVRDHEPRTALDGGADGLDFYRALASLWTPRLRAGWMLCEVGEDQAGDVCALLRRAGLTDVGTERDSAGTERVVFGRKQATELR